MKASTLVKGQKFILESDPDNVWICTDVWNLKGGKKRIQRKWVSGQLENLPDFKHRDPSTVSGWQAVSGNQNVKELVK